MKTNETRIVCPNCGTEFAIAEKTQVATGVVIGKDSNLGTIHPQVVGKDKAAERIEALRNAGVDVSNLFSMTGSNGGDFVVRNDGGNISILDDNDPIFNIIKSQGSVPNGKLFRRWVMSQMFRMLAYERNNHSRRSYISITEQIRMKGTEYQWRQLEDELYAQNSMYKNGDMTNFEDRNRWFNKEVVVSMLNDYLKQMKVHVNKCERRKCKGTPYKRICAENVFISDIQKKVFSPIEDIVKDAESADTPFKLWWVVSTFNRYTRKKHGWNPNQSSAWIGAYKGSGAFFTMQNMIRFHGCTAVDDNGKRLSKDLSYTFLELKANQYVGEGWRMIGLLRKMLADNNVDINKKRAEWLNKK